MTNSRRTINLSPVFSRTKLLLLAALFIPCVWMGYLYNVDFIVLHDTVRLVITGDYARVYSDSGVNGSIGRYFYGPISLILFAPLGLLKYEAAKLIWLFLQCIAFVLFWRLLARIIPWVADSKMSWAWLGLFILSINPLHNNFQSNNIQLFLAVMLLGAEVLSRNEDRKSHLWAGLLISLAGAIKIFPFFIFAFYWVAKPRLRIGLAGGLLVSLFLPFVVFGAEESQLLYRSFWANLTSYGQDNSLLKTEDICCLPSLLARIFAHWGVPESASMPYIKITIVILCSAFLGYLYWNRKRNADDSAYLWGWGLALSLMAFLNPSTRPHYYIFYIPAGALLFELEARHTLGKAEQGILWISLGLIALTQEGVTGKALNNQLEAWSVPTIGMLLLCGLTFKVWRERNLNA